MNAKHARSKRENAKGGKVMSMRIATFALASFALLSVASFAVAQQSGTAAEARAMLDRGAAALKANEAAALVAFNDKANKDYHDRDLYVFCYNMTDGTFIAHVNPAMMGKDVRTIKVGDDTLGQRLFDTINSTPAGAVGTVNYLFPKPGTTDPVPKESYVTRVGNTGCGVGYYK